MSSSENGKRGRPRGVSKYTGKKHGFLTRVRLLGNKKWLCSCECGGEIEVYHSVLEYGRITSCGCTTKTHVNNKGKRGAYYVQYRLKNKKKIRASKAEYQLKNKQKIKARASERYLNNRESFIAKATEYQRKNTGKVKAAKAEYRQKNIVKVSARERAYIKNHPEAASIKRAVRRLCMPKWVDRDALRALYEDRDRLAIETGIPHHVDHMVPIKGKTVCGLHVPWNLQVLEASENLSKGNKLLDTYSACAA